MLYPIAEERIIQTGRQPLAMVQDPEFEVQGALYFLDGHYLFRHKADGKISSKFVTAADLAAAFSGAEQDSGWLDPGVVRVGGSAKGNWVVYSAPAQKVEIRIDDLDKPITVPIPRTVMLGIDETWYMWAMKDKYFMPDGEAFNAVFPNVYSDGKICWGQNKAPRADAAKARMIWELFFMTPFNGDLANEKSKKERSDIRVLLRRLAEDQAKVYPVDDLIEVGRGNIGRLILNAVGVS